MSPSRSQAVYHGLAHHFGDGSPNTVIVLRPGDRYVCIGYHQDIDRELDRDFCLQQGLPILRREVGGGAVYLDRNQIFVQWIMREGRLPRRLDHRFEIFLEPLIATYRDLGIEAAFRAPNDIHVHGRKICGTAAGRLGNADVLVGNFLLDFDVETMSRILRPRSEAFRRLVRESLERFMTSIAKETGVRVEPSRVVDLYRHHAQSILGESFRVDSLESGEQEAIAIAERKLADESFVEQEGGLRRAGVKIHQDVWVAEAELETSGTRIRVTARLLEGHLDAVSVDETPPRLDRETRTRFERSLLGTPLDPVAVAEAIGGFFQAPDFARPEGEIETWTEAILKLKDKQ